MNYLTVENISKSYGELQLFSDLSFSIHKDDKIAFVAKNGSGKTSILNLLLGEDTPDSGNIIFRNDIKVSYLPQSPTFNGENTIKESIHNSDLEILRVIDRYERALQNPADTDAYQKAFEQMERSNAWEFDLRYKQILFQLKLEDLNQKIKTLSGGQKKRLALAEALISNPDLLILDEPTNHLDLEMIEWLEDYFKKAQLTLFMVTHDRYFLERVCNEIIELDNGNLYTYKGNYTYYLENKQARMDINAVETHKAKRLYKKELDWMRRQPKARTSKSKSRIDDFSDIKKRAHQRRQDHKVQLEINMERLGSKIVELHNISKVYNDKILFGKFDYTFKKGERVGIIGKNGTGKSTFLNILTKNIESDSGKVVVGETVKFGYYTQGGIHIKEGQKVIEVIKEYGEYIPLTKGRQISAKQLLERFLFDSKKQYDYVEKLSGGEQKRLYLCTVLIQNPNFLILDEPTNDLDIVTLNILEDFLLDFPGCIVIVSHDRYFMDKIVDHLLVFNGDTTISDFPGNYSDYREYIESNPEQQKTEKDGSTEQTERGDENERLTYNEKKELKTLESQIRKLELEKNSLEEKFHDTSLNQDEITSLSNELQDLLNTKEEKEERWFELSEKYES